MLFLPSVAIALASSTITGRGLKSLKQGDPEPSLAGNHFRLYEMRFCPYCERVLLTAYLKGIKLQVVNINMKNKPDWFVARKPQSSGVPVLEHDQKLLADSKVIIQYLDELYPKTSILPKDPYQRAKQRLHATQMESLCDVILQMTHSTTLTGDTKKLEMELIKAETLLKSLQTPFFAGTTPGYVDILLFPFIERLDIMRQFNDAKFLDDNNFREQFPKLEKWFERMQNTPAVAAAQQPRQHLMAYMINKANGKDDYDIGLPGSTTATDLKLLSNNTLT